MSTARRRWDGSCLFPRLRFNCAHAIRHPLLRDTRPLQPWPNISHPALRALTGLSCPTLRLSSILHLLLASFRRCRCSQAPSPMRFYHAFAGKQGGREIPFFTLFWAVFNPPFIEIPGARPRKTPLWPAGCTAAMHPKSTGGMRAASKKSVDFQTGLWYKLVEFWKDRTSEIEFESAVTGLSGRYLQNSHNVRR